VAERLPGKRVLITGTGGGQGAAAQKLFVAEGARVVGCDVKPGQAEAVAQAIAPSGGDAVGWTVDLADPEAAAAWVRRSAEHLGGIDVVYNNASATAFAPIDEMSVDAWRFVITNELDIAFHVTRAAWPYLKTGGGAILTTCSISGLIGVGRFPQTAHAAAKGALLSMTRQLAAEGAPFNIRAVALSPGFIDSPATEERVTAEAREYMLGLQMLKRAGTPRDVAYLALYLASDEAAWVTGANFVIDGGWTAWAG